jgi:Uma2 family endonuclease
MTKLLLTFQDLLETPDDGYRYELIDGELHMSPPPDGYQHQRPLRRLVMLLARAELAGYGTHYFAPTGVVFDEGEHNYAEPDAFFLRAGGGKRMANVLRGAPDLVVEVLSPSTRRYDLRAKRQLYARFGVTYYWVADPTGETIQVYTLAGADYGAPSVLRGDDVPGCPLFPGITTTAAAVFAPDPA